jgi:hypothetical protein
MTLTYATIKVGTRAAEKVQFNPASLRVTISNQIDDKQPQQASKPTSYKLDVELMFDTTEDGSNVYEKTRWIRYAALALAEGASASPATGSSGTDDPPRSLQEVEFTYGPSTYVGYIESINETIDYFSSDGVPMRSTLQISLKGGVRTFVSGKYGKVKGYGQNPVPQLPEVVMAPAAKELTVDLMQRGLSAPGNNSAVRGIAALNGMESMRTATGAFAGASAFAGAGAGAGAFAGASAGVGASAGAGAFAGASAGAGAGMAVSAGAQLHAAAGFAASGGVSAGASAGFGIGASAGLSAGAGLGASVGVGMSAGASAGIGMGGGMSASMGAGMSAGIGGGIGASAGIGIGGASGGIGLTTSTSVTGFDGVTRTDSTSSVTGFDGVTRTTSSSTSSMGGSFGSGSAGAMASAGAFAGLGSSRTSLPPSTFNLDSLLPPPLPATGSGARYDISGRVMTGNGQIAASYTAQSGVKVW